MNNYNHYRDRDDFAHRNNMPPPKPELRTPVSNRSDFARASIPTNSTTARTSRMAEPSRNSVAAGFGSRPSIAHRPSLAPRNSIVTGSLSGRMSMLPVNYKRIPQMLLNRPAMLNIPKNTQDKGHVANMCNRIYEFLQMCEESQNPPNFQYTEKTLRAPSNSDFRNIFEFLFRQLDDRYILDPRRNMEEEVLKLFQALGYPYTLKKSAMATMGAQHSWPTLLTALNWLITLIEEHYDLNESLVKDEFHLTYSYFTTCYRKSAEREKHGVDCDFSDELEIYRNLLQPQDMDEEIANRKANRLNNEKIIQQMKEDVEREHEECRNLMAENADLENDIIKLKDNVEASEVTVSRQEEFIIEQDETVKKMVETLSKLDSENIKKEEFIRHQTMSGEEARTLIVKRKTLKEQLNSARDQNYEADKKKSELEPRFYKKSAELRFEYKAFLTSLQDFCSSFHSLNNVQGIKWSEYEYDAASQEFINSPRNKLTELIDMLKKEVAQIIEKNRHSESRINRLIEDKTKCIGEMKTKNKKKIF